jgi:hypothetical protein
VIAGTVLRHRLNKLRRCHAFSTLLMWCFFAIDSGWTIVCQRQERGMHSNLSPAKPLPIAEFLSLLPLQPTAVDKPAKQAGAAQSAGLKVCSDGSHSLVKLSLDFDLPPVDLTPPLVRHWPLSLVAVALLRLDGGPRREAQARR